MADTAVERSLLAYVSSLKMEPVWAAFSTRGRRPLVLVDGTLNREKYQTISEAHVIPFSVHHHGSTKNIVYQQDNCEPHRSKSVRDSMDGKQITLMTWPSQSPGFNPIESAWAFLKKKLRARPTYPTSTTELFNVLQSEWLSIPDEYFTKLICLMPTRFNLVNLIEVGLPNIDVEVFFRITTKIEYSYRESLVLSRRLDQNITLF